MSRLIFSNLLAAAIMAVATHASADTLADTLSRRQKTQDVIAAPAKKIPPVVHSAVGDSSAGVAGRLRLYNIGKRQQYSGSQHDTWDTDVFSPKSAIFSPDGKRFYVNSLEGCRTVVYDSETLDKIATVKYNFPAGGGEFVAPMSGYYPFTHYPDGATRSFSGKPVEMALSHDGRYLWVPFYRRSFDINAQDPSAMVVVDTHDNQIVRLFETGPLAKMVAVSTDGGLVAVTHWGDNTIGLLDVSADEPARWHYLPPVTVGNKLTLNFPLDSAVNRDAKSGFLLRGTVFTPDDRYLLVSGMAGPLQVIDVKNRTHIGSVNDLYGLRHLEIKDGYLYGSHNISGMVLKVRLDSLIASIDRARNAGSRRFDIGAPVDRCAVGKGARTLNVSPDGKYLFVACNSASAVYVVDAERMRVADTIRCDSYPVGLAVSPDGHRLVVTSQGRESHGGNAVTLFRIERFGSDSLFLKSLQPPAEEDVARSDESGEDQSVVNYRRDRRLPILGAVLLLLTGGVLIAAGRRRRQK